jgi:hypothetical protein
VGRHRGADDRQAQAAAAGVAAGGEEPIPDPRLHRRRDHRAVVVDRDPDPAIAVDGRDRRGDRRAGRGVLRGVGQQVVERGVERRRPEPGVGAPRRRGGAHRDAGAGPAG